VILGTGRRGSGQIPAKAGGGDGRGAVLGLLGAGFDQSPGGGGHGVAARRRQLRPAAVRPAPARLRPGTTGGAAR
jgi:hypothetical protein